MSSQQQAKNRKQYDRSMGISWFILHSIIFLFKLLLSSYHLMDDLHSILKSFSAGSNSSLLAFDSSYKINLSDAGTNPIISMQRFSCSQTNKYCRGGTLYGFTSEPQPSSKSQVIFFGGNFFSILSVIG